MPKNRPRHDPIPGPPPADMRRFRRALGLVALFALVIAAVAVLLVVGATEQWQIHMMVATGVGIFLTVFLGGALMLLVFASASSGHDEAAHHFESKDDNE